MHVNATALSAALLALTAGGAELYFRAHATTPIAQAQVAAPAAPPPPAAKAWVGVLTDADAVEIATAESGRVARTLVQLDDGVEPGQRLVELDRADAKSALDAARARLAATDAEVASAQVLLAEANESQARAQLLGGVLAQAEQRTIALRAQDRATQLAAADARRAVAQAEVQQVADRLERLTLRAPIRGRVAALDVKPGGWVEAGTAVVRIVSNARHVVRFAIAGVHIGTMHVGDDVRVTQPGHGEARARVTRIQPDADPALGTQLAEAELVDAAPGVVPGLPLEVRSEATPPEPARP